LRDGIFAALSLHTFYRNADIVEYAMETQVANVLQSLFETRGADFYIKPNFYVFKLLKGQIWIIQSQVLLYWKSIV
jgi:alpha-L-arabinofuranosidase